MVRLPLPLLASALAASLSTFTASAQPLAQEPGAMLRSGEWGGDIGTYGRPQAFEKLQPAQWPGQGWHLLTFEGNELFSEPVAADGGRQPAFLQAITAQLRAAESRGRGEVADELPPQASYAYLDQLYLRVPGARLRAGRIPVLVFKNGTTRLQPLLDHRYQLTLQGRDFAFSVRNGQRGRNGESYGSGAHYTIEYGGQAYLYSLEGFGWGSSIKAIADVDGDGKPDFFIQVDGNNSGLEAVLLSSKAKPGKNPATASLASSGC